MWEWISAVTPAFEIGFSILAVSWTAAMFADNAALSLPYFHAGDTRGFIGKPLREILHVRCDVKRVFSVMSMSAKCANVLYERLSLAGSRNVK